MSASLRRSKKALAIVGVAAVAAALFSPPGYRSGEATGRPPGVWTGGLRGPCCHVTR